MKIEHQTFPLVFPAITFCSVPLIRSSFYQANPHAVQFYINAISNLKTKAENILNKSTGWLIPLLNRSAASGVCSQLPTKGRTQYFGMKHLDDGFRWKSKKICTWNGPPAEESHDFDEFYNGATTTFNFLTLLEHFGTDYDRMTLLCWFHGKMKDCSLDSNFVHTLSDLGPCRTFNDVSFLNAQQGKQAVPFNVNGIGPEDGFKVLLDVAQEEYCFPNDFYRGSGILFGLKEKYSPIMLHYEKGLHHLPVGYEIDVSMKMTRF